MGRIKPKKAARKAAKIPGEKLVRFRLPSLSQ